VQTDAAFDSQIDNLCREIGRRGLARQTDVVVGAGAEATVGASCPRRPLDVSEAIPPVSAMAPGVAAAPAHVNVADAAAPSLTTGLHTSPTPSSAPPTPPQQYPTAHSPSMQQSAGMRLLQQDAEMSVTFSDIASFMREERELMMAAVEKQRKESEAMLERYKVQAQEHCKDVERLRDIQARERQIIALQSRLGKLHAAKQLSDDELEVFESTIADSLDAPSDDKQLSKMIALSERMGADDSFSRQLRRKFLPPS
jgi:hypothetical protein